MSAKITVPYMFLTIPGGRNGYIKVLSSHQNELPVKMPKEREVMEIDPERAPLLILQMLVTGKTVFADERLLTETVLERTIPYVPDEMIPRFRIVERNPINN